ncbi:MAG: SDR family oxidoreductase [Planctomycetes bacterium]|nr:SDR family oxidoreductase [Planctomycetota bacterium]
MKALVTGATGFLGARLCRALRDRGWEVAILRRAASPLAPLEGLELTHHVGDVTEPATLAPAMRGADAVFHLAASLSFWRAEADAQRRINVEGTRNVVQAALDARVKRLVHTSSVAAVGIPTPYGPADELLPFSPASAKINYFKTKHEAEEEVRAAVARGLDAVIVNPSAVFGPGDYRFQSGRVIRDIHRRALPAYTSGGTSVVDVDDVVDGHLAAFEKGRKGERYILGGENLSWEEIFRKVAREVGVPAPSFRAPTAVLWLAAGALELHARFLTHKHPLVTREMAVLGGLHLFYDANKAAGTLAFRPRPFAETIQRTFQWYKDKGML